MPLTVFLVTGANRGLGLGFMKVLALRDDVMVFAGVRDFSAAGELKDLSEKYPGKIHILQLTACNEGEHAAAAAHIKERVGRLDVVIANAGLCNNSGKFIDTRAQEMRDHFEVNTLGPLILFQYTYPLLCSGVNPQFVLISSSGGSISVGTEVTELPAYGVTKAAANYLVRKIHFEHENLTAFAFCPGGVATDMAIFVKSVNPTIDTNFPFKGPELTATALLGQIDAAARETYGGKFRSWDGAEIPW